MLKLIEVRSEELTPYIPALAQLRMKVFRDFPYLYAGDEAYEKTYLKRYSDSPDSFAALVLAGDEVVGATTALPLAHELEAFKAPFLEQGYDLGTIFYFGESVLLHPYRGQGWGKRFFIERENEARRQGFDVATFCAVERPEDHPKRPADYRPLDGLWEKRGFEKRPELSTTFSWQDVGEAEESSKPMTFWLKQGLLDG